MTCANSSSVRVQDDLELEKLPTVNKNSVLKFWYKVDGSQISEPSSGKAKKENNSARRSLKRVLSRVFSEDYDKVKKKILDPRGPTAHRWNMIFFLACLVSLFVDPLFFFLPEVRDDFCMDIGTTPEVIVTIARSIVDVFYVIQICVRFCTAYVAPSSRVLGRGELVINLSKIASRYMRKGFWIDVCAALPLPQLLFWAIIPNLKGSSTANTKNAFRFILMFQYLLRLYIIWPLSLKIITETGVVTETAWPGAVFNLVLYTLASHVIGACWYLLSIEREEACWINACSLENQSCQPRFFECRMVEDADRKAWFQSSNITNLCDPNSSSYPFGIYGDAVTNAVTGSKFFVKYFYCLWWGLRNLSSQAQNLVTSTFIGETTFSSLVATMGLILLAMVIGNVQKYIQSTTVRIDEWRIKRADTEQWMHHRQLPPELRQSVRKYDQYKWVATRGVDEEALLNDLPRDLRKEIKRHLCFNLIRRVSLFDQMDERMLDAICERLKPALRTQGSSLVREGDPVNEMFFIIRGNLNSYTTNGGCTGFFNSCRIGPGDFCGEELLTWVLHPHPSVVLPLSTRTVKAISEVEAFALRAADLKFVALQFRRLHTKQLRHKFRFYSHQWRTWAACSIQAAWRRYNERNKLAAELRAMDCPMAAESEPLDGDASQPGSGLAVYAAAWLAATTRRLGVHNDSGLDSSAVSSLQKPPEPDFSVEEE